LSAVFGVLTKPGCADRAFPGVRREHASIAFACHLFSWFCALFRDSGPWTSPGNEGGLSPGQMVPYGDGHVDHHCRHRLEELCNIERITLPLSPSCRSRGDFAGQPTAPFSRLAKC
jgi:hypothetical protein